MGQEGVRGAINIAKAVRKGDPIAIAKVAGATAGTVGLVDLKKKANEEEENQRRTITQSQPKPRVLQTKQEPIKQAPSIVPQSSPCLLYTSPSPRDRTRSRMPSSA